MNGYHSPKTDAEKFFTQIADREGDHDLEVVPATVCLDMEIALRDCITELTAVRVLLNRPDDAVARSCITDTIAKAAAVLKI